MVLAPGVLLRRELLFAYRNTLGASQVEGEALQLSQLGRRQDHAILLPEMSSMETL
jgi:hypothetical protein